MQWLRPHITYANVVATLALVLAAAGGTTALAVAIQGSKKSDVNRKGNIRSGRVTAKKLADADVTAAKLAGIDVMPGNRDKLRAWRRALAASDYSAAGRG